MPSLPVNLLDSGLGIQNILDPGSQTHMPEARPLASTVLREAGLDELYTRSGAQKQIEAALCPPVGDGSILQPEIFHAHLQGALDALKESRNPAVRTPVRDRQGALHGKTVILRGETGRMLGG